MVKGFVLWPLFVVFLILAVTAVDMGDYTIAVVMGGVALACAWAAPMGTGKKKAKDKDTVSAGG